MNKPDITLREHLIRARAKVKPENNARSSRKARKAALARWEKALPKQEAQALSGNGR
jgi:hypothetical protein